jgi:hypothetical protein
MTGRTFLAARGPLAAGLALYATFTVVFVAVGVSQSGGTFVYAQDDPYIHLAMARNLAEHGVWGIRPDQFASASSSPLWTILLAALWKAGATAVWWPLVVNLVCGAGVIVLIDRMLRPSVEPPARALLLAAVILVTPLPTLALIGMEHSLQVLLTIAVAWRVTELAERPSSRGLAVSCILAALLAATRYEGLFLVAAAIALLVIRRRYGPAAAIMVSSFVPVAAFAAYSVGHGALLLPNSVLMKSNPGRFATLAEGMAAVLTDWATVFSLFSRPPELVLVLCLLFFLSVAAKSVARHERVIQLAALFVIAMLLHACLVKLEWFYRYEAALIAVGVLALGWLLVDHSHRSTYLQPLMASTAGAALVALLALPLGWRALSAAAVTPGAMRNVFEQQYQMGQFFSEAYPDAAIAVNDIGAVAWLSRSAIVDVYGLATQEVAELKRRRAWNRSQVEALIARRDVRAVAIYEKVFAPLIPPSWTLVGEWRIQQNVGVSEDTVGFFAPAREDAQRLRSALDAYAARLPADVVYSSNR